MAATFVIFLREGVEASMIISILLAYLDRLGQRRHFRDVAAGVAAAMLLVLVGGVVAYFALKDYAGSRAQMVFETVTYLVAAAVLTYMTFWMRDHARGLSAELEARANSALDGRARLGLALLSFQAVGREGLETMVFTLAIVFASSGRAVIVGGLAGLAASMIFAFAVYRLGRRANVRIFFKVVGALLIIFGAGILADAIENLQRLQWLPFFTARLWDSARILPQSSALGDIFHTFFGYAQRPSVLQLVIYFAYLVTAVSAYLGWARSCRAWGLRLLRRRWLS